MFDEVEVQTVLVPSACQRLLDPSKPSCLLTAVVNNDDELLLRATSKRERKVGPASTARIPAAATTAGLQ